MRIVEGRLRLRADEYAALANNLRDELGDKDYVVDLQVVLDYLENCTEIPFRCNYSEYLASEDWANLRKRTIELQGNECQICGSGERLQVHHISYQNGPDPDLWDLVVLCKDCHNKVHTCKDEYRDYMEKRTKRAEVKRAQIFADIVNRVFPEGIEGKRKQKAAHIIRSTYLSQSHIKELIPDFQEFVRDIKKA